MRAFLALAAGGAAAWVAYAVLPTLNYSNGEAVFSPTMTTLLPWILGAVAWFAVKNLGRHSNEASGPPEAAERPTIGSPTQGQGAPPAPDSGKDGIKALIKRLQDRDGKERAEAALSLGRIGPSAAAAVPQLLFLALKGTDATEQFAALFALGEIGGDARQAAPLLASLTKSPVPSTRDMATATIAKLLGQETATSEVAPSRPTARPGAQQTVAQGSEAEALSQTIQKVDACPQCGKTTSPFGGQRALNIFRCSCGATYCDQCSGGGLIDLPRCPASPYHEGMKRVATVPNAT